MFTPVLVGIDIGTSSVKVCAVHPENGTIGEGSASFATYAPYPGWAEQDPEEWWNATVRATATALSQVRETWGRAEVRGIGVTGQMHSFVLVDRAHKPLRHAITWMDTRARDLVPVVQDTLDRAGLADRLGNAAAPGLTLCPLIHLIRTEQDLVESAVALLSAKDYLRLRLTGEVFADPTDASAMLLLDISRRTWLSELEGLFSIPPELFPPLRDPWYTAGVVSRGAFFDAGLTEARIIGDALPQDRTVPVAIGSGDQQAAALGTGVLEPGEIQFMVGTGGQILSPLDTCPEKRITGLNLFCHHRNWLVQGSVQNVGSALTWAGNILNAEWREYEHVLSEAPRGDAPFFVPYLTGERTPIMDEGATGGWLRLRRTTTREELLYAAMEGVVFGLTDALEAVERVVTAREIRMSGGGTRSREYVQFLCDAIGKQVSVLPEANATALGSAVLAGVAAEVFDSLEQGVERLRIRSAGTVEPDPVARARLTQRRNEMHAFRSVCLSR